MRLSGKSIVVTGASAGMGHAIVERFVKEGALVTAVARRRERLEELAESLKEEPGKIVICTGDIGDENTSSRMIDLAVQEFGRLDVLLNVAGIMDDNTAVGDVSDEMLDRLFRINTLGPLYAMQKAVQVSLSQNDESGNIIMPENVSNIWMSEPELVELFGVIAPTLRSAIRNIYNSGALKEYEVQKYVRQENGYHADVFSFPMIVALAFRIDSFGAEQVRNAIFKRLYLRKEKTNIFFSLGINGWDMSNYQA